LVAFFFGAGFVGAAAVGVAAAGVVGAAGAGAAGGGKAIMELAVGKYMEVAGATALYDGMAYDMTGGV